MRKRTFPALRAMALVVLAGALSPALAEEEGAPPAEATPVPTPVPASERVRELRDYSDSLYPEFLISADVVEEELAAPPGEPLQPTADIVMDGEEGEGEYLILDDDPEAAAPVESRDLDLVFQEISAAMEGIRMSILAGESGEQLAAMREDALTLAEELVAVGGRDLPARVPALEHFSARLDRLTANMLEDYLAEDPRQMESTDRLLRSEVEGVGQLLVLTRRERYRPPGLPGYIPDDWARPEVGREDFARQINGWNARRLLREYQERLRLMEETFSRDRRNFGSSLDPIVRELFLLGVELSGRDYEVHPGSRRSFVDSALRLELLAENLQDYLKEENLLYARRHVRVMRRAVEYSQAFLPPIGPGVSATMPERLPEE